jgi:signal transduction histidine kinase
MIQSLKKKFVLINMSLVLVVLLAVFSALSFTTAANQQQSAERNLNTLLMRHSSADATKFEIKKPNNPSGGLPQRNNELLAGFVVSVDESGLVTVESASSVTVSDETAQAVAEIALDASADSGMIRAYSLRYLRVTENGVTRIAFLDASSDIAAMAELIVTSLLVGGLGLLAFFFVSLFLANLALRPVEAAWNRQKQFVADASHELKTPLTVILANQKILLSHPEHSIAEERQWVENTQSEGNRMKALVEDLLFLAKTDRMRVDSGSAPVNLSDTVQGTLLTFASVAFESGVSLEDDIQPGITLAGNEAQMRRLCGILLDNAMKYAGAHGSARIELHSDGGNARLSVRNTGAPIAQADLPHVFERFYRVDRARSEGGYGLGLSIAENIVRSHGGRITVASTAEAGTTFTVTLPLRAPGKRRGRERV